MICRAVRVLTAVLAVGLPGCIAWTRERALSDAATRALDRATADWAHSSVLCAAYSGRLEDVPLDSPLVEANPNITGLTQEALWGLFTNMQSSLNIGVGYADGKFILYREDGYILAFRDSGTAPCEESYSNEAATADCRKVYSYGSFGQVSEGTVATYNTFPYDPRERAWYMAAESSQKGVWCPIFPVSPVVPPATIPGLSFATPFYAPTGDLIGVCASDIDSRNVIDVLAPLAESDMSTVVYVVEDSTLYLLGSSIGEHSSITDNDISVVMDAKNWIIRKSANTVIQNSEFLADGSYFVEDLEEGGALCVELSTYSDSMSGTTAWKLVSVVMADTCSSNYERPLSESSKLMLTETTRIFEAVASLPGVLNFQSGSSINAPLSWPILDSTTEPPVEGTSQQSTWAVAKSVVDMSVFLHSVGTVYVQDGTFLAYVFSGGSTREDPLLAYREVDDTASCPAFGSFAEIPTDCTRLYSVNSNGTVNQQDSQFEFDGRDQIWYAAATERGAGSWSGPHYSTFSPDRLITYSIPGYSAGPAEYHSVSFASLKLDYFDEILQVYAGDYAIGYIVDRTTGFLLATSSTGTMENENGNYILAVDSDIDKISDSYEYITDNGIHVDSVHVLEDDIVIQYTSYNGNIPDFIDLDIVWVGSSAEDPEDDDDSSSGAFSDWEKGDLVIAVFVLGSSLVAVSIIAIFSTFLVIGKGGMKKNLSSTQLNGL